MRLRLLAGGLAAVAAAFVATPATAVFDRQCRGLVDAACYDDFCGIYECVRTDCVVYTGVFGDGGNAGICVGVSRPPSA